MAAWRLWAFASGKLGCPYQLRMLLTLASISLSFLLGTVETPISQRLHAHRMRCRGKSLIQGCGSAKRHPVPVPGSCERRSAHQAGCQQPLQAADPVHGPLGTKSPLSWLGLLSQPLPNFLLPFLPKLWLLLAMPDSGAAASRQMM